MKLNSVVSVSTLKDLDVWEIASSKTIEFIDSDNYQVFVPARYVSKFKKVSPSNYQVISENDLVREFSFEDIKNFLPEKLKFKTGWYYQQFIKIKALQSPSFEKLNLIWDADTVPLKKLEFKDPHSDTILYYHSHDIYEPFFDTLFNITGLKRQVDRSFIAQCFPAPSSWVNEFTQAIEKKFSMHWIEAICRNLPGAVICEFSEYESLGNYFKAHHPDQIAFLNREWLRGGALQFENTIHVTPEALKNLSEAYDFVAFEEYMFQRSLLQKVKRKLWKILNS